MRDLVKLSSLVPAAMLLPAQAFAHPGHGQLDPRTAAHWLSELPHAAWLLAAVGGVGVALLRYARHGR